MVDDSAFAETEVEINEPEVEVAEMPEMEIDIGEVAEVADIAIDDIEVVVDIDNEIEKILTPIYNGGNDHRVVSPAGGADIDWSGFFGPGAPGQLGNSESDATPI